VNWTHACCEVCWIDLKGLWVHMAFPDMEPVTTEEARRKGWPDDVLVLKVIQEPIRLLTFELVPCCFCTQPTFIGVYVRHDPRELACAGQCGGTDDEET
jgi:hypothetical protein